MRVESTVTSVSWIPSEAIQGPMRVPMDIGVGHYDPPPPDRLVDVEELIRQDACRFVNRLTAYADFRDGEVADPGYAGGALVGKTTARLGPFSLSVSGQSFPIIQHDPEVTSDGVTFTQTAGGRTGVPLPRRTQEPPYLRITPPTAWTTLSLTLHPDGTATRRILGASPFPRHWVYDDSGTLVAKSGSIDFSTWTAEHSHENSPWNEKDREVHVSAPESVQERELSMEIMGGGRPEIQRFAAGDVLIRQGDEAADIFLILDGLVEVEVDGNVVAQAGPGSIIGERAGLEGGRRTSTVRAMCPVKTAVAHPDRLDDDSLTEIASGHRREIG